MNRRQLNRTVFVLAIAFGLTAIQQAPVSAQSVESKQAEVRRLAEKREAQIREAERLNQILVRQRDELAEIEQDLAQVNSRLVSESSAVTELGTGLSRSIVQAYVNGSQEDSMVSIVGGLGGPDEAVVRSAYLTTITGNTTDLIDSYRSRVADTELLARKTADQQRARERAINDVEAQSRALAAAQDKLASDQARVAVELREAVAAETARVAAEQERKRQAEARRQAEMLRQQADAQQARARAAAARPRAGSVTPTPTSRLPASPGVAVAPRAPTPVDIPDYPAPSAAAATAIAEAKRQLGKQYVFGTNGPNTFDCSGLTQWAWAKAGVSMAHYTGSQAAAFPRIPVGSLAPGDLVFFNINLGHMGMYLGGGQYIHAPQTGDVVKISSLDLGRVVVAVRPG